MFLTRISVDNPVFATMMMVALLVVGLFSYQRLGIDQFPNVDFPTVVISTTYPGASPEAVEADVTRKIEDAVNTISGVDTLTSRSYEGRSVVTILFNLDAFLSSPKASTAGDAFDLATFGNDFSKMLVTGADPFKGLPSLPSMQRINASLGGAPKHEACEAFGRGPGVTGLIAGGLGLPPEWTDKPLVEAMPGPQQE